MVLIGKIHHLNRSPSRSISKFKIGRVNLVHHIFWSIAAAQIGIHPDNIRHVHVGRLGNRGDVIQRLLHLGGKIRRKLSRQRIGASLRRHVENVIRLDSGRIDVSSLRPSRRMDHLSMGGTADGNTVDLDVLPVGESPHHQDSPCRRMITNRLPIDIVHGSDILRMGHIDVHPDRIAEIHSCRAQHAFHMAQRLAHLLLKIPWKTAVGIPPILTGDVERPVSENAGTRRRANIFTLNLDDLDHTTGLREQLGAACSKQETQSKQWAAF